MANRMGPQEKSRRLTGSMRYREISNGECKTQLFESAIFALAGWRVSKALLIFTVGIDASKVQRLRFLPVRGAVLRPNAMLTIGSEGV